MAAVNAAVKKYGFKDLDEYDQVVVSIVAVLDGIDPKTKQYTDPIAAIKKEIAAVQADKTMKPGRAQEGAGEPERGIVARCSRSSIRATSRWC